MPRSGACAWGHRVQSVRVGQGDGVGGGHASGVVLPKKWREGQAGQACMSGAQDGCWSWFSPTRASLADGRPLMCRGLFSFHTHSPWAGRCEPAVCSSRAGLLTLFSEEFRMDSLSCMYQVSRVSSTLPVPEVTGLSLSPAPSHCAAPSKGLAQGATELRDMKPLSEVVMLSSEHQRSAVCMWRAFQAPQCERSAYVAPSLLHIFWPSCSFFAQRLDKAQQRDCSSSHIRPPGGSGTHSQAACRGRMGKTRQKLPRQGKQPGYPRIRNILRESCPLSNNGKTVLNFKSTSFYFTQKLSNLNSLIIILFWTITLISLAWRAQRGHATTPKTHSCKTGQALDFSWWDSDPKDLPHCSTRKNLVLTWEAGIQASLHTHFTIRISWRGEGSCLGSACLTSSEWFWWTCWMGTLPLRENLTWIKS